MTNKVRFDKTYGIVEYEVDPSWERDFSPQYFEYRKRWKEATDRHILYDFPLFLEVGTTAACNYKCPMCPAEILKTRKSGNLPSAFLEKLIKECKREKLASITLDHGSEPLMDKNLSLNMLRFKEAGVIDIFMHTNGSLLSPEMSRKLIQNGLTKINFSLDAITEETYNKIRVGGKYKEVLNNIFSFLDFKKEFGKSFPRTRVSFIYSQNNKHEKNEFYDFWKDKVNLISFQKKRDYQKFFSGEKNQKLKKTNVKSGTNYKCNQLWQLLVISSQGNILPCLQDYQQQYILGNLKNCTIKEAWHSKQMNSLRKMHSSGSWYKIPMCSRCVSCRVD